MSTTSTKPTYDWKTVARAIDHTVLKPEATPEQIVRLCTEAKKYEFAAVCVQPSYVELAAKELAGSSVKVATVVGFPNGATLTAAKAFEAAETARLGATEVDMVINVGQLKAGNRQYVENDIRAVAEASHQNGAILKVIIETCLLTRDEKIAACELSVKAGADFVKTSTGFSTAGATVDDVALMRGVVGPKLGVKAAGGVRTAADATAMLNAGASRVGASASVAIVRELGAPE
jgi:deoxyribose-phosphate aldolase